MEALLRQNCLSFPIFGRFGSERKFNLTVMLCYCCGDFVDRYIEKFFAIVDAVRSVPVEYLMQSILQSRSVFAEDYCVHIKMKRYRRIAEFVDSVHGVESARHTDLVDVLAE